MENEGVEKTIIYILIRIKGEKQSIEEEEENIK